MVKKNKYRDIINSGKIGSLKELINLEKLEITEMPETNRIRIYLKFIIEYLGSSEISASRLIKEFCLLEKAVGGEYNNKFIMKDISKSRYIPIASYDHYRIIVFNGMKKLGISLSEETILNEEQLKKMSEIIWH
ncbi:MAG: hypothetical protein ABFQ65_02790 [Nanoarchaeota archaeon]